VVAVAVGAVVVVLVGSWRPGGAPERPWNLFEVLWGAFGEPLGSPWEALAEPLGEPLGDPWASLGVPWVSLGSLGLLGAPLELPWKSPYNILKECVSSRPNAFAIPKVLFRRSETLELLLLLW
jgi:hypothetical protein